jgi:D-3-phosphoglycerate dehydrogenase
MSHWKILLTDGLHDSGQEILRSLAQVDDKNDISAEDLLNVISDYDALIVRGRTKVTPEVIAAANKLKVIGRAGVGVDNINLAAAREKGIAVVNAPISTTLAVAELTLGLMFALARMLPKADSTMKAGQWAKKQLEGIELNGKTLGVIGVGNIGCAVAGRAGLLGMKVLGFDPDFNDVMACVARPVSLKEMYAQADFITIHVPLSEGTRGLISREVIAKMKPGVRIICAARGGVIDEAALLEGLNSGQVAGAALDVFAKEPPGLTDLVAHSNVVAAPHIGAQTAEAQNRASEDIATEVLAALGGQALRWRVT